VPVERLRSASAICRALPRAGLIEPAKQHRRSKQ
jgi:hypothetical protein